METKDEHSTGDSHNRFNTVRLEAFSDGVLAIIITITVLELKVPMGSHFSDLKPLLPLLLTYLVSFHTVGTYWNNHHHLLRATDHTSAGIMWTNLYFLFCLSLIPFSANWLGSSFGSSAPTVFYSANLFMCGLTYYFLYLQILKHAENREALIEQFSKSKKGQVSLGSYGLAVIFGFFAPTISYILIILVAMMWFIPDRRIERAL